MNIALTRADENEVGEQQLTPCAPLNCKAAARRSKPLEREGGKEIERRKRHISITLGQHEDGPRCWRAAREKFCCSPPRSPAGLRALRHAVGHGHRKKVEAADARVRCLTTWRTCHPLLRCCGRQWCPHGSCERRDDKIEARQNQSSDCKPDASLHNISPTNNVLSGSVCVRDHLCIVSFIQPREDGLTLPQRSTWARDTTDQQG